MAEGDLGEKKVLIITVAIAAVLVIVLGAGLYFGQSNLEKLRAEFSTLEMELRDKQVRVDGLEAIKVSKEKLWRRAEKYFKLLPNQSDLPELMRQINQKSRDTGLALISFKQNTIIAARLKKGEAAKPFEPITFKYVFRGDFHEIARFINHVEDKMARYLEIRDIVVSARENGMVPGVKGPGGHDFTVEMVTFRYRQGGPGGASKP